MFGTIKMLINGNIIGMGGSIGNGLLQLVCVPDGTVHGVCGSDPAVSAVTPEMVAAVSAAIAEELGTDVSAIRIVSMKKI